MKAYQYVYFILLIQSTVYAKEYKAVFDCSSSDMRYIASRMAVVEETVRLIELKGNTVKIAMTLHGGCIAIATTGIGTDSTLNDAKIIQKARNSITRLHIDHNADVIACAMSLDANGIEKSDLLPFVHISDNSFIDTIGYQNDGYAVMTFP